MQTLGSAIALAAASHEGQLDKAGEPYILHPLRVMQAVNGDVERIAAVLHDTVEDCGLEIGLIRHRFGVEVAEAVDALSRRKGESYDDFIGRCAANPVALAVKLADLRDNLNYERLSRLPKAEASRLIDKYLPSEKRLIAAHFAAQGIALRENAAGG